MLILCSHIKTNFTIDFSQQQQQQQQYRQAMTHTPIVDSTHKTLCFARTMFWNFTLFYVLQIRYTWQEFCLNALLPYTSIHTICVQEYNEWFLFFSSLWLTWHLYSNPVIFFGLLRFDVCFTQSNNRSIAEHCGVYLSKTSKPFSTSKFAFANPTQPNCTKSNATHMKRQALSLKSMINKR